MTRGLRPEIFGYETVSSVCLTTRAKSLVFLPDQAPLLPDRPSGPFMHTSRRKPASNLVHKTIPEAKNAVQSKSIASFLSLSLTLLVSKREETTKIQ